MKTVDGVPQFEDTDYLPTYVNEELREYFAERRCVNCRYFYAKGLHDYSMEGDMCSYLDCFLMDESGRFSCAAFEKRGPSKTAGKKEE